MKKILSVFIALFITTLTACNSAAPSETSESDSETQVQSTLAESESSKEATVETMIAPITEKTQGQNQIKPAAVDFVYPKAYESEYQTPAYVREILLGKDTVEVELSDTVYRKYFLVEIPDLARVYTNLFEDKTDFVDFKRLTEKTFLTHVLAEALKIEDFLNLAKASQKMVFDPKTATYVSDNQDHAKALIKEWDTWIPRFRQALYRIVQENPEIVDQFNMTNKPVPKADTGKAFVYPEVESSKYETPTYVHDILIGTDTTKVQLDEGIRNSYYNMAVTSPPTSMNMLDEELHTIKSGMKNYTQKAFMTHVFSEALKIEDYLNWAKIKQARFRHDSNYNWDEHIDLAEIWSERLYPRLRQAMDRIIKDNPEIVDQYK